MVFTSCTFLFLFFPLTMLLYFLLKPSLRNAFLFFASLLFYGWGEVRYLFLLLGAILLHYLLALGIDICTASGHARLKKALLALTVCADLALFCVFKYQNFLLRNLNLLLRREAFPTLSIALPIGISFYLFQSLSYVIDVYRGEVRAERDLLSLGLYVAMFPQLVAGPIVRYVDIRKEIFERQTTIPDAVYGIRRFIIGFAKKLLLADALGHVADQIFLLGTSAVTPDIAWLGALCYTFQIYFDFSGYSDMAIGMGRMLGFHFRENFRDPYYAKSVTEFWRRWHISLSGWFRDYLYIPLGGNRRGNVYLHLLFVFIVTGLWHGASWKFIAWGLWHGMFLILERLFRGKEGAVDPGMRRKEGKAASGGMTTGRGIRGFFRWGYTMLVVLLGWVLFRAESLRLALQYIKAMFGLSPRGFIPYSLFYFLNRRTAVALILAAILSFPVHLPGVGTWDAAAREGLKNTGCLLLLALSIIFLVSGSYNAFIYFQF